MSTPDHQRRSPRLIQKGHTVEELENQLFQKPTTISRPVTAEELEREMRGEMIERTTPQDHRPTIPQYGQHMQVCVTSLSSIDLRILITPLVSSNSSSAISWQVNFQ